MSLDVWLRTGRQVEVGGKKLWMLPLPLSMLYPVFGWLEKNATDVVNDFVKNAGKEKAPNPLVLVTRVLSKVDIPTVAVSIFSFPKNPETGKRLNSCLNKPWWKFWVKQSDWSKKFFDQYLDIPTSQKLLQTFTELNDLPNLIKNLQSLPVTQKVMEAASLTFGIPYLNSLLQSTGLAQSKLEGSQSRKSTDLPKQPDLGKPEFGTSQSPTMVQ